MGVLVKQKTYMGWSRKAVELGLIELEKGMICQDNHSSKGRKKTETKLEKLSSDIKDLVDNNSQADPKLKTLFCYTKISARAVREALIELKGYQSEELPSRQTIGSILNRMGYRLKKHKK